jgi:hypothetical protein
MVNNSTYQKKRFYLKKSLTVMSILLLWYGCSFQTPSKFILFDFESDSDLNLLDWSCHVLYSLSDTYATHGSKSLKLDLYPSDYPGFAPKLTKKDWRGYTELSFDIYNPQDESVPIWVRVDDRKKYPDFKDRYNKQFVLSPGLNQIHIPFDTLVTSGDGRYLDVKKIYRFFIFMTRPYKRTVLYLDYIRLL